MGEIRPEHVGSFNAMRRCQVMRVTGRLSGYSRFDLFTHRQRPIMPEVGIPRRS